MMSGWSAPPCDEVQRSDEVVTSDSPLSVRRRALVLAGPALLAAASFPASRLRAATAPAVGTVAKPVFDAGSLAEVLRLLDARPEPSSDIDLHVPAFVENGALVPVEISSGLPGAQDIYIISEANPFPLVAFFSVPEGTEAFVSTRIKVASSCNIHALIRSDGRFLSAVKPTSVTQGGCGA